MEQDTYEDSTIPACETSLPAPQLAFTSQSGEIYCGDSLQFLNSSGMVQPGTVNLIMTSPPFGLVRKKEYGNVDADDYLEWFRPFAEAFYNALADNGSLVIDIGGAWIPGQPTRSLYHYGKTIVLILWQGFQFHNTSGFFSENSDNCQWRVYQFADVSFIESDNIQIIKLFDGCNNLKPEPFQPM